MRNLIGKDAFYREEWDAVERVPTYGDAGR